MKKVYTYILIFLGLAGLNACDKIEGNRFENNAESDTNYTFPPDAGAAVYRVLLEDYTGHTCGNCPAAAHNLYTVIKPAYGDKLVTLGVHANYFAEPCPPHARPPGSPVGSYSDDFRTPAGEAWYTFFNFSNNPLGMVNRKDYISNNVIKTAANWNTEIAAIINSTPKVKIRIHNVYNTSTREVKIYTETKVLTQLNGNFSLNVVLAEDNIIAWQLDDRAANHNVQDYVHRHVMRGSINGAFGEPLITASLTNAGTTFFKGYKYNLASGWNADNVHVIVFLFDDVTKEILNVAEAAVIE